MTISDFCEFVKTVKYKPGWSFEIDQDVLRIDGDILLKMSHESPDADKPDDPEEFVFVYFHELIDFHVLERMGGAEARRMMRMWIRKLEDHETDEWLRFGEERYIEPH